jgi:hypothetical protein
MNVSLNPAEKNIIWRTPGVIWCLSQALEVLGHAWMFATASLRT